MSNSTTTFIALRGIVFLREFENPTKRFYLIDGKTLQESDQTGPHDEARRRGWTRKLVNRRWPITVQKVNKLINRIHLRTNDNSCGICDVIEMTGRDKEECEKRERKLARSARLYANEQKNFKLDLERANGQILLQGMNPEEFRTCLDEVVYKTFDTRFPGKLRSSCHSM